MPSLRVLEFVDDIYSSLSPVWRTVCTSGSGAVPCFVSGGKDGNYSVRSYIAY